MADKVSANKAHMASCESQLFCLILVLTLFASYTVSNCFFLFVRICLHTLTHISFCFWTFVLPFQVVDMVIVVATVAVDVFFAFIWIWNANINCLWNSECLIFSFDWSNGFFFALFVLILPLAWLKCCDKNYHISLSFWFHWIITQNHQNHTKWLSPQNTRHTPFKWMFSYTHFNLRS